jgi:hypothetical protein
MSNTFNICQNRFVSQSSFGKSSYDAHIIHTDWNSIQFTTKRTNNHVWKVSTRPTFNSPDFYDRDLGGYKFVSLHKDHLWHPTTRSNLQEQEEKELCQQLENCADKLDKEGYGMDDFFVDDEEDEEETIAKEETDIIFQMASTQRWSDSDETDLSDIDEYE